MKKIVALCLIVFAAALIASCSPGANGNPVAPETSGLLSATNEARSNNYVKVCHHNPNYLTEGGYQWTLIVVDNQAKLNAHCGYKPINNHGDFTQDGLNSCYSCDLSSYSVGANCSACD